MIASDDTVRGLGHSSIGTDKPTRDKLKAAAAAADMCLSDYLRVLADKALKDTQGKLPGVPISKPKNGTSVLAKLIFWLTGTSPKREQELYEAALGECEALGLPTQYMDDIHAERMAKFNKRKQARLIEDGRKSEV